MYAASDSAPHLLIVGAAMLGAAGQARAYHFQMRWVEQTGTTTFRILGGDGASTLFAPGTSHRIRLQFGVFDDADGAAPAGGLIGWNDGTLSTTGGVNTRTPGRLNPFAFAPNPPANGLPSQDPFEALTAIDCTLGTQSPFWGCGPDGQPLPMPVPTIRGINTFISVYEITTVAGAQDYAVQAGGSNLAASGWELVNMPEPPDCSGVPDPRPIDHRMAVYDPVLLPPSAFSYSLMILVPTPASAALLCGAIMWSARRRR